MISFDTQLQLAKVIHTIAKEERALETIRQSLIAKPLFSPYTAFLRLQEDNDNLIDESNLKHYLE